MVQLQLREYLSKDDFPKTGVLRALFLDAGAFGTAVFDGVESEKFEINIELPSGDHRCWTMNKTSQRAVAEHYGPETEQWVGQPIELILMDANVSGKIRKVIYARGKQ